MVTESDPSEERTWREASDAKLNDRHALLLASIATTDLRAQAANDTLQKLLEAHMEATSQMAQMRYDSAQQALAKVDSQLALSRTTAMEAVNAVDARSAMRHDSAGMLVKSTEEKLIDRIGALQKMIEMRAEMAETAIEKADAATQMRFLSVNEFRQTLTDQATQFVTRSVLDARMEQMNAVVNQSNSIQNALTVRLASLEGKLYVGGACIIIVLTLMQLALNFFRH